MLQFAGFVATTRLKASRQKSFLPGIRGWLIFVFVACIAGIFVSVASFVLSFKGLSSDDGLYQAYMDGTFAALTSAQKCSVLFDIAAMAASVGLSIYLLRVFIKKRRSFVLVLIGQTAANSGMVLCGALFQIYAFGEAITPTGGPGANAMLVALVQYVSTARRAKAYFVN